MTCIFCLVLVKPRKTENLPDKPEKLLYKTEVSTKKETNKKETCLVRNSVDSPMFVGPGLEVIKLEFILRLKIKRNDWLFADTWPQTANHCALF